MANPSHDLLPCPFCGGPAVIYDVCSLLTPFGCRCTKCGALGGDAATRPAVAEKWNRRATPSSPSTAPEVDELQRYDIEHDGAGYMRKRPDGEYVKLADVRAVLASRPAEVDDEGLPPLPAPWPNSFPYSYTAEQYRQGQRDAVAADRARREVGGKIPRASNDALIKLAKYWKLDGDWMTCRGCRRSLIASRDGEELNHGDGCKFWDQQHPWAQLRGLIALRPAPAESSP